jgi:hypothetical protein
MGVAILVGIVGIVLILSGLMTMTTGGGGGGNGLAVAMGASVLVLAVTVGVMAVISRRRSE